MKRKNGGKLRSLVGIFVIGVTIGTDLVAAEMDGVPRTASLAERRRALTPLIELEARRNGVRADLLHAVIEAESAYRADAVSSKGAVGLMQLMPATAARYGVTDRTDPRQNVAAGAAYLSDLERRYNGDLVLALAAYNAGETAVDAHDRRVPPYPETRSYVRKVLRAVAPRRPRCWTWARTGASAIAGCGLRSPRPFER